VTGESLNALTQRANALKADGRVEDAIKLYAEAVRAYPASAVAEHNLAGALGDFGRYEEAVSHCRSAFSKGLDAPETWLVLARALMNLDHFEDAQDAFKQVLARRPEMVIAHFELAQLIWMYTADMKAALGPMDAALAQRPGDPSLLYHRSKAQEYMGDVHGACQTMGELVRLRSSDLQPLIAASYLYALNGDTASAVTYGERAAALAPANADAAEALGFAYLADGQADRAVAAGERARQQKPLDQNIIALLATAWRVLGDTRGAALYDYEAFVKGAMIDVPSGWSSREAYLRDLAAELKQAHPYKTHPFGQSVRHGSQRPNILSAGTPAISAFSEAADGPIQRYINSLGAGEDILRRRNTRRWAIHGIWSVWLKPGGFHHDHVHPDGWLSSAFYVELPDQVEAGGHQGWIKFGEPGTRVTPALQPEHFVKPQPGMLVLFPSYMWHGTVPFEGEQPRLTMAMDIVPG
jgi:Flp pilus assembly protein TadD